MATLKQQRLSNPPAIGLQFGEVNPDKVRDQNVLIGLFNGTPFRSALESALYYIKNLKPIESEQVTRFMYYRRGTNPLRNMQSTL